MMSLRAAGAAAMALLTLLASAEGFTLPGAPVCGAAPRRTVCVRGRRSAGGVVSMSGGLEDLKGKVRQPWLLVFGLGTVQPLQQQIMSYRITLMSLSSSA